MFTAETEVLGRQAPENETPTLNHSNVCADVIEQILENKTFKPLPELTLDIDINAEELFRRR